MSETMEQMRAVWAFMEQEVQKCRERYVEKRPCGSAEDLHEERENVVKKVCHIPENIKVHSLMIAGYPEKPAQEAQRFHEEYIHQNEWKD